MEKLNQLIHTLNTKPLSGVSVLNIDTNQKLFCTKTHFQIVEDHGTAEEFFNDLFAKGYKNLRLTERKKNGSVYKAVAPDFVINLSDPQGVQPAVTQAVTPAVTQQTAPIPAVPMQENIFANSFGLGQLDMINLFVSKNDATRLQTENNVLLTKVEAQQAVIDDFKEQRYNREGSKGNQEMLLGAIQALPQLISMVKGTPAIGLAQPVEYSSPTKNNFAKNLQSIDDNVLEVLLNINTGLTNSPDFSTELSTLLQKYQLWQA